MAQVKEMVSNRAIDSLEEINLKKYFAGREQSVHKCFTNHIEMKDEEYDELDISILPASKLTSVSMSKM